MSPSAWLARACALLMVPAIAGPLQAVEPDAKDETEARLDTIVVEDQRLRPAEIFEDTAVETEVIDQREIRDLPATSLEQVISTTPGIRTQARVQGEEAAVSFEGLPPEYSKILVNGQRYSGEIGGVDDLRDFSTLLAGRVEIKRGPQGLRYGADAAGGVIDVESKRAPDEGWSGTFEGALGQDALRYGGGHLGFGSGDHGFTLTAIQDQIDGFDPPSSTGSNPIIGNRAGGADSRRLSRDVFGTWSYEASPSLRVFADAGWRREDEDFIPTGGGSTSRRDQERWRGVIGADAWLGEATSLTGSLTWFQRTVNSAVGREFVLDEDEWKLDLAGEHFIETGPLTHSVMLGVDARLPSLQLSEVALDAQLAGLGLSGDAVDESLRSAGLFLITESAWSDFVSVEVGLRYEFHSRFENKLVAQAAFLLSPFARSPYGWLRGLKFRAGWGRNYRTPSLRDLYQPESPQLGGAYFLAGNPELTPENSRGYRAGLEWSPGPWLSLAVTGFQNDIEDSIRSVLDRTLAIPTGEFATEQVFPSERILGLQRICTATGFIFPECAQLDASIQTVLVALTRPSNVFQKTNLDRVRTRGIETIAQIRPHGRIVLDLAYTLLDTRVIDSERPSLVVLPNQPKHQFDARLRVLIPRTETTLALTGRWRDRSPIETSGTGLLGFSDPTTESEPSLLLNFRLSQPVGKNIEFFFDANNLTNERIQDSYAIRGRTLSAGIRVEFGAAAHQKKEGFLW